ncbi:unnamed protein product [Mycena citricolor]|uniref:Transposase n=1 Tax=Mycena citricolor TaxID=2018698 RepID=A0AAD2HWF8_9AGAR|nr:unnamed protein product [Mycena citricolor]
MSSRVMSTRELLDALPSAQQLEWSKVVWSDECYVHLSDNKGRIWVTRTSDKVYNQDCLAPSFKQSPIRVMVWGCIAHGWKGPLIVLEYPGGKGGGMTAKRYQDQVLRKVLFRSLDEVKQKRGGRGKIHVTINPKTKSKREVNSKTGEYNQVATVFIPKSSLSHIYN